MLLSQNSRSFLKGCLGGLFLSAFLLTGCKSSRSVAASSNALDAPINIPAPGQTTTAVQPNTYVSPSSSSKIDQYNVVVGSFLNPASAEELVEFMKGRGYDAFMQQAPNGYYRVIAGGFKTREEAITVRGRIVATFPNLKDAWLLVP